MFDAWNGFYSIMLKESDRHITTFKGEVQYLRAPQGYIASGDGYTSRYDRLVEGVPRHTKCIDDALLWSSSITEAFHHAASWLDICAREGVVLNIKKYKFAQRTVEFAGFTITESCVKPAPKYTASISEFPRPRSISDIRSWFGLINHICDDQDHVTVPGTAQVQD